MAPDEMPRSADRTVGVLTEEGSLGLERRLGPWSAASIVVGTMVGTGIFLLPGTMARDTQSVALVFLAWVLGAVLALFGALSYAELGAAIPEAGGDYAYLRRGFGETYAYLFGWTNSVLSRPCSAATIAAGLLSFVCFLAPAVGVPIASWPVRLPWPATPYVFSITPAQIYAAAVIWVLTLINCLGVRLGGNLQVVLTAAKVLVIAGIIAVGLGSGGHGDSSGPAGAATVNGFLTALVGALWAYEGWSNVSLVGSEVVAPQRNLPRALIYGVLLVAGLYLLLNVVCFRVLPFEAVASSAAVVSDVARTALGDQAAVWLTLAMIVSALGTLNSSTLTGARVPYAMARDHLFFRCTARVHPRFHTPTRALIFQAAASSLLVVSGTFEDLYSLFIFTLFFL